MTINTFDDMRLLVSTVDGGSFTAGAARLGLSKQFVSRRVAALEQRLGAALVMRSTRRLVLTEAGRDYVERARRILADVDDTEQAVSAGAAQPRGLLRVTAPSSFTTLHLSAFITEFLQQHPAVRLELELTDEAADLLGEGYDMAIRIGILPDSSLIARKLVDLDLVLCASPAYLQARGQPATPTDLADHSALVHGRGVAPAFHFQVGRRVVAQPVKALFCSNNGELLRDAAVHGLGIAQLPMFIAGEAVRSGRLRTLLDDFAVRGGAAYAVMTPHRQRSTAVRAFVDHLVERLRPPVPWGGTA